MNCLYCNAVIQGKDRSDEHIFPQWIINYLDAKKIPLTVVPINRHKVVFPPRHTVAMTMTHKICATCNSGWLSAIDGSCKDIVTALMKGTFQTGTGTFGAGDVDRLYVLIYKMFLNFLATGPFKVDKLPFYRNFYESQTPPSDVVLFGSGVCTPAPLAIGHLDNWRIYGGAEPVDWSSGSESGLRFKFFVQFGHAAFVMCCSGSEQRPIIYDKFLFTPIISNAFTVAADCQLEPHPAPVEDTLVNRLLWSVGLGSNHRFNPTTTPPAG